MTISEIIKAFSDAGVREAEREAYLTLEYLFGVSYAMAVADRSRKYDKERILSVVEKRKEKIPLQYIFGEWYFMGEKFYVSPDCLIPRADTEILVEKAINVIKSRSRVADLCTGSGCIGISLLQKRADIEALTLVDISEGALNIARKNAEYHRVDGKCEFILGDVCRDILIGEYDAIVSNPPYILSKDMDSLPPEVKKEPHLALCGGADGLDIIRPIVYNSHSHLKDGGNLLIEFGYDHNRHQEQ